MGRRTFKTTALQCRGIAVGRMGDIPNYFEFKTQLSSRLSRLKIRSCLKFEVLFFTFRKSRKPGFPRRTSGLAKRVVNFRGNKMYLLAKRSYWKFLSKSEAYLQLEGVLNSKYHEYFQPVFINSANSQAWELFKGETTKQHSSRDAILGAKVKRTLEGDKKSKRFYC